MPQPNTIHIIPFSGIYINHDGSHDRTCEEILVKDNQHGRIISFECTYHHDTHTVHISHEQHNYNAQNAADIHAFFHRILHQPEYGITIRHQYNENMNDYLSVHINSKDLNNINIDRHTHIIQRPIDHCIIPATYNYPNHITPSTSFADIFTQATNAYKKHYAWIQKNDGITPTTIFQQHDIPSIPGLRTTLYHSRDINNHHNSITISYCGTVLSRQNISISHQDPKHIHALIDNVISEAIAIYPNRIMQPHNRDSQHQQIQKYKNIQHILPTLAPNLIHTFDHIHQLYAQHYRAPIPSSPTP